MEVMFQLTANTCSLLPKHVKRDFNQWADDLTHPSFSGFDEALRLEVPPLLADFKIFPWILQHLEREGDLPAAVATEPAAPVPARSDVGHVNVRLRTAHTPSFIRVFLRSGLHPHCLSHRWSPVGRPGGFVPTSSLVGTAGIWSPHTFDFSEH